MKLSMCGRAALLIVLSLFLFIDSIIAQTCVGALTGKVVDQNSIGIEGASVSLTKLGESLSRLAMSAADGSYKFDSLEPGKYSVLVQREGFAATDVPEIDIVAGTNDPIWFELTVPVAADIESGDSGFRQVVESGS